MQEGNLIDQRYFFNQLQVEHARTQILNAKTRDIEEIRKERKKQTMGNLYIKT
jgi:hypothetical protein